MTKDEFLIKSKEMHGDKYDYSLVPDKITTNMKITVICNEKYPWGEPHGKFTVMVNKHIYRGDGCTKCSGKYKRTKDDFVKEATYLHGGIYTYDNFVWNGTDKKSTIHCIKHNIDFEMTPSHHLNGQGCPKCRYEKSAKSNTHTKEWFVSKANKLHNSKYDYSKTEYIKSDEKVCIICHEKDRNGVEHGEFWMTPDNHLMKHHPQGCPKCGRDSTVNAKRLSFDEFVKAANKVHDSKYTYDNSTYINTGEKMRMICPIHGEFWQKPTNHIYSQQGCPKCGNHMSISEDEIYDLIKDNFPNLTVEQRNHTIIKPYELDIYIPEKKLAIEFNGLIWHSDKFNDDKYYHLNKTELCEKQGIRLIHIFEDEWLEKRKIVESKIKDILGLYDEVIDSDKCTVKKVTKILSYNFLALNNLQSDYLFDYSYGLYNNDELVSLITFRYDASVDAYELRSFSNKLNTKVTNSLSKLFEYFVNVNKPNKVITYIDKRIENDEIYKQIGFEYVKDIEPDYFYVSRNGKKRVFKYDQSINEDNSYKIYDCGYKLLSISFNKN